jgi:hypothetical protein
MFFKFSNICQNARCPFGNVLACEQALKVKWEPASMTNEFEYLRLKSWREILIGQMLYKLYGLNLVCTV